MTTGEEELRKLIDQESSKYSATDQEAQVFNTVIKLVMATILPLLKTCSTSNNLLIEGKPLDEYCVMAIICGATDATMHKSLSSHSANERMNIQMIRESVKQAVLDQYSEYTISVKH